METEAGRRNWWKILNKQSFYWWRKIKEVNSQQFLIKIINMSCDINDFILLSANSSLSARIVFSVSFVCFCFIIICLPHNKNVYFVAVFLGLYPSSSVTFKTWRVNKFLIKAILFKTYILYANDILPVVSVNVFIIYFLERIKYWSYSFETLVWMLRLNFSDTVLNRHIYARPLSYFASCKFCMSTGSSQMVVCQKNSCDIVWITLINKHRGSTFAGSVAVIRYTM